MFDSDQKVQKWKLEVEVHLEDRVRLLGFFFIKPMQRLSELLNDSREFLPFQATDGLIIHIRKCNIAKVVQLDQQVDSDQIVDAYEILGVPRNISDDELKKAYHKLCSHNHPDKLQSLDLSPEFASIANSRLTRIIDAYQRILATRGGAQTNGQKAQCAPDP